MRPTKFGAILESIDDRMQGIQEGIHALKDVPQRLASIENRLGHIESDMQVVKEILPEHSRAIAELQTKSHSH